MTNKSRLEEAIVAVVCIAIDALVIPAICMVIWNNYIIKDVIVAPEVLLPLSYGTAIIVHIFLSCVKFSLSRATLTFDKDKLLDDRFKHISSLLENMTHHIITGYNKPRQNQLPL